VVDPAIVAWAVVAVITVVSRTIVANHRAGIRSWIIRGPVIRLGVIAWTEIVEQEWERERDPEAHTLSPDGGLGNKDQGADRERENQQPFHLGGNLQRFPDLLINRLKSNAAAVSGASWRAVLDLS
jgi:hypothetical protein